MNFESDYDDSDNDYDELSNSDDEYQPEAYGTGEDESNGLPASFEDDVDKGLDDDVLAEAQGEIAGDFERLVQNLNRTNAPADIGPSVSSWLISIDEGEDFNLEDDTLDSRGTPQKKSSGGSRNGPRPGVELSHQVRAMIGEAAAAYVDRDLPKAMNICQEVIRIEPAAHAAWNTLALVHEDRSEFDAALKLKIMAAHLQGDSDVWRELGRASRELNQMQQALYCFRKAVSLDPRDVDAIWDRSVMLRETGELRAALNGFLSILKIAPYHMGVLLQIGALLSSLFEFHRGISLYKDALVHYQETTPDGPVGGEEADCIMLLVTLADFCNTVGEYEQTVNAVRDGARWVQGRAKQRYWASVTDDREYDVQGCVRSQGTEDSIGRPQGFFPLDPNLRHRLALARLALGDLEEGQMHGSIVLQNDVREYCLLFTELAGAYFAKGLYNAALRVYEELAAYDETSTIAILMQISACHRYLGDFDKAVEVMKYILEVDGDNVDAKMRLAEIYEILEQPQLALSLVNEVIAWRKLHANNDGSAPSAGSATNTPLDRLFDEKRQSAKTKNALPIEYVRAIEQSRQAAVDECFTKLDALDPEGPDRAQWMKEASTLVDVFRETRELFGGNRFAPFRGSVNERRLRRLASKDADKDASEMASRLQLSISFPKEDGGGIHGFRRHSFDKWLSLFIQYAFYATTDGMYSTADEVLRHLILSNAFVTFSHQTTLRLALLACATAQRDYPAILEHSRRLIFTHQFNNDPLRLYLACLGGGIYTVDTFIDTNFQKLMRRELDVYKMVASGEQLEWKPARNRWGICKGATRDSVDQGDSGNDDAELVSEDEPGDGQGERKRKTSVQSAKVAADPAPSKATVESPILLALYGQLSASAKSYQSALFYLYQAYDLQPDDPVICLCLAVSSISRAMTRQSDNRHHLIAQGLAFIQRYRTVRKEEYTDEIEYNFGRFFHQLGIQSLAAKHYHRVLDHAETRMKDSQGTMKPTIAKEAAYNLVLIYGTTGGHGLAKGIVRKWLSF